MFIVFVICLIPSNQSYSEYNVDIEYEISEDIFYQYNQNVSNRVGYKNEPLYITINEPILIDIAKQFDDMGHDKIVTANLVLKWIQNNISYDYDSNNYIKPDYYQFPIETLYLKTGDCEDVTFLYVTIMRILGYDVITLFVSDKNIGGHALAGINLDMYEGYYIEQNGVRYYTADATTKLTIGKSTKFGQDIWLRQVFNTFCMIMIVINLVCCLYLLETFKLHMNDKCPKCGSYKTSNYYTRNSDETLEKHIRCKKCIKRNKNERRK